MLRGRLANAPKEAFGPDPLGIPGGEAIEPSLNADQHTQRCVPSLPKSCAQQMLVPRHGNLAKR